MSSRAAPANPFLADLRVHHTGGPYSAPPSPEKTAYWNAMQRRHLRRQRVKRALLAIPLVERLNGRYRWFEAPDLQFKS